MHLSGLLSRSCRLPNTDPVPFKDVLPLQLKNRVSGKNQKAKFENCLHEMSLVISCLQANEFQDKPCEDHARNFQKCYDDHLANKHAQKALQEKAVLTPGTKNFTDKQIKVLFRKYPNI